MLAYSDYRAVVYSGRFESIRRGEPIAPVSIQIDLSGVCNQHCRSCLFVREIGAGVGIDRTMPKNCNQFFDRVLFDSLVDWSRKNGVQGIELTGGGEPSLHPEFEDLVGTVIGSGLDLGLITNGSFLSSSVLDLLRNGAAFVRVSLDASDRMTYKRMRGVDTFELVLDNLSQLIGGKAYTSVSYMINRSNFEGIYDFAKLMATVGVPMVRFGCMYSDKLGDLLFPDELEEVWKQLAAVAREDFGGMEIVDQFEIRRRTLGHSFRPFRWCLYGLFVGTLGFDGKLYACCGLKYDERFMVGDLRKDGCEVLMGARHRFIDKLNVQKCPPCWMDGKNAFLNLATFGGLDLEREKSQLSFV